MNSKPKPPPKPAKAQIYALYTYALSTCNNVAGYLRPLGYPGLINPLFSPANELQRVVLNLGNLDFDIVSDFDIRISDFAGLGPSTLVVSALQIRLFMQNKPNFRKSQMNVNNLSTMNYEKKDTWLSGKNKPNSKPNKPNQSQLKPIKCQNKANTNPIKPNPTATKSCRFRWTQVNFKLDWSIL